jgi:hypothetical protein
MAQDLLVSTATYFQAVGESGHPVECPPVVNGLGQRDSARCQPRGVSGGMREAVAEDFSDQLSLGKQFANLGADQVRCPRAGHRE